ncbi:MAG: HD domain-containing protein [Candidatus Nanoarchaeia archaeon]|jgi:uncharacterized protein
MDLNEIQNYAESFMNHSGHSFDHVLRVYNLCSKISKQSLNKIDTEVLLTSALLHDIARDNESKTGECHASIGAKWAKKYLESINFNADKIEKIVYCIENHRHSKGIIPKTLEARILQEADRLDATGAIGIIRTTSHNVLKKPYHLKDPLAKNREIDDYTYSLDHFFFKLLKLKDEITVPLLKKEAAKRHEFMLKFLERVNDELTNNSLKQATLLIELIRKNSDLKPYDIKEPFASQNTLVSKIMEHDELEFIQKFLDELKSEIL